jgi:hypothetical protein
MTPESNPLLAGAAGWVWPLAIDPPALRAPRPRGDSIVDYPTSP